MKSYYIVYSLYELWQLFTKQANNYYFFSPDLPCSSLGPLEGKDYNINKGKLYFGWEKMLKKIGKKLEKW